MSTLAPPAPSFTFIALQQNRFTWTLTDGSNNPISGAVVVATLYANRNIQNVTQFPGTPVIDFTSINLVESPVGTYSNIIAATFNPPASTIGFVVVVTATLGSTTLGVWSTPAVIDPPQLSNDLVQLDLVKQWLGISTLANGQPNTDADGVIQFLISSFSTYVYNRTGITSFNSVKQFTEIYDGNGASRMFLRNRPIQTLISVQMGSYAVPQSTAITAAGVYIDPSQNSLAFRSSGFSLMPPSSIYPYLFIPGQGNIQVVYTAGYTSVPFDLQEACMKAVKINYVRKDWVDLASKSLSTGGGATGTTRYRDWALPPEVERILEFYSRYSR